MKKEVTEKAKYEQIRPETKKPGKLFNALAIGFLAGVFIFGMVSWSLAEEKNWGLLLPLSIPLFFIYQVLKKPKRPKN